MLANVFTKTVLDRWKGVAIAAGSLGLMLLFGMAVYRDVDLSVYSNLPEAMRSLMNIGENADASGLAYGAIYSSYGALTLASLALSMGAASIAGEERNGTIGLLLGNPRSRTQVLLSKMASTVVLVAAGTLLLWGLGRVVPEILSVDIGGRQIEALMVHMFVIALFHGFLALAIGAWTGKRGLASGATAGFMVLSFFAVGLLPFVEGFESVAKVFPWHYYEAGTPLVNGIQWGNLGLLLGLSAVLGAVALVGLERRDLRGHGVAVTLIDRLRENRFTKKVIERLAGSARVSSVSAKALSDHQTLLISVGYIALLMSAVMGPFFLLIDDVLKDFVDQLPEGLLAMVGYADMSTPEGWFQGEMFSLTLPIAAIAVTAVMGSKALAGEEANRTMGLLLTNPIGRTRVLFEKTTAMVIAAVVVGILSFVGTALGSLIAGLGMSMAGIAATCVLLTLLSIVFGALALALGAATGRTRIAMFGTAGLALAFLVLNAYLPLSDSLAGLARWTPFYYYLTSDPFNTGMHWGHAGVLAAIAVVLIGVAVFAFERRDLRQTG
ncbi:ABC transporter permease subunit [bacterium]|nr:ABC transporter permease subunit [bacterium]